MNPKPIKRQICLILIILATSLINPLAAQKKQKAPATPTISAEEQFEEELHRNIFSIFKAHVSDENDTVIINLIRNRRLTPPREVIVVHDTIDGVVLTYDRYVYFDQERALLRDRLYIDESKDGLDNRVSINVKDDTVYGDALFAMMEKNGYNLYGKGSTNIFTGHDIEGLGDEYAALFYVDTFFSIMNLTQLQNHIEQATRRSLAVIRDTIARINYLESIKIYKAAYAAILGLLDRYRLLLTLPVGENVVVASKSCIYGMTPVERTRKQRGKTKTDYGLMREKLAHYNDTLNLMRSHVLEMIAGEYYEKAFTAFDVDNDMNVALLYCDSVLNDSVLCKTETRKRIDELRYWIAQQNLPEGAVKYSSLEPEAFQLTMKKIEDMIEQDIALNKSQNKQNIALHFQFSTYKNNLSNGTITLTVKENLADRLFGSKSRKEARQVAMQRKLDSIAQSPDITICERAGIYVHTQESLDAGVEWVYGNTRIDGSEPRSHAEIDPYVDSIENSYFTIRNPQAINTAVVKKPYKRVYTFGVTKKTVNEKVYSDIYLEDFETSNAFSWMPSLILPGVGTVSQGYRNSVGSRLIPFLIFGSGAVAGILYERNAAKNNPDRVEGSFSDMVQNINNLDNYKNVGNYIAIGCGTIAGAIYLTDLIQSIKATITNLSRSKKLRNDLKEQQRLRMHTEAIQLQ